MNKEVIPVFGIHTHGAEYFDRIRSDSVAKASDLIPQTYGWPDYTADHVKALHPSLLAIDGLNKSISPRLIPYCLPCDPFELKGSRRNMFLIGTDLDYDFIQKDLGDLSKETARQYWIKEGDNYSNQVISEKLGGIPDFLPLLFIVGSGAGLTLLTEDIGPAIAAFGFGIVYTSRLFILPKLLQMEEKHQLARRSKLFLGLLQFSRPIFLPLTTIEFRNAITAIKLADTQKYLDDNELVEGSTVALFGNAHAYGKNLWNSAEAQKAIVTREVKKMVRITQRIRNGKSLNDKEKARFIREMSYCLGEVGVWSVRDRPVKMTYRNFARSVPLVDSFVSPTITSIVENVVENNCV